MHKYSDQDQQVLELFRKLNTGPYNPASYTSIREFAEIFPKKERSKFVPDPEPPKFYTENYKKTLLSTL